MIPPTKNLKIVTLTLVVGLVILAGLLVLHNVNQKEATSEDAETVGGLTTPTEEVALQVEAASARIGDLVMRLSVTGITKAQQEITISPKVGGRIVQLSIEEGQFVRQRTLLMKLDDREYRLTLAEAQDKLLGAQVEYGMLLGDEERGTLKEGREAKSDKPELESDGPKETHPFVRL